nr:hypothetical protein Iba_chr14aCG13780 [Ipomoea batatas]
MASHIGMNPCKESHKKEEKIKEEMYKKNEMNTTNSIEFGSYHILDPPESSASVQSTVNPVKFEPYPTHPRPPPPPVSFAAGQIPTDKTPSKEHEKKEKIDKKKEDYYDRKDMNTPAKKEEKKDKEKKDGEKKDTDHKNTEQSRQSEARTSRRGLGSRAWESPRSARPTKAK